MGLSVRVHTQSQNTNMDKLHDYNNQQSLSCGVPALINVSNKAWSLKTSPLKKKMSVVNRHPPKSHCWANPVLKGKSYSAFILLKTLAKPVPPPLCSVGFIEQIRLSMAIGWGRRGHLFHTLPRSPPPPSPASVYPSPDNGWLLAIKQHFPRNPWHWSNGITVGWFNPWIVNRILPLTRKILLHRITRIT